jgi:hypothetical protein
LFQSCKAVYDHIIDLKISTPQIIINYGLFLEEHKYFEEAFRVSLVPDMNNNEHLFQCIDHFHAENGAVCFYETLVSTYNTIRGHNSGDQNMECDHCENLKCRRIRYRYNI